MVLALGAMIPGVIGVMIGGCGGGVAGEADALVATGDSSSIITARRDALKELTATALITADIRLEIEAADSVAQIQSIATKAIDTFLAGQEFDGNAAFKMLEKVCAIGSRTSGSDGMRKQQELLLDTFEKLGAEVILVPPG